MWIKKPYESVKLFIKQNHPDLMHYIKYWVIIFLVI
jgi:hypothetical protein